MKSCDLSTVSLYFFPLPSLLWLCSCLLIVIEKNTMKCCDKLKCSRYFLSVTSSGRVLTSTFELMEFWPANLELGLWKNMFYMHAITKIHKGPHIKIQNNFQNMSHFYDSFNGLWVKSLYWYSLWWHVPGKKWLQ